LTENKFKEININENNDFKEIDLKINQFRTKVDLINKIWISLIIANKKLMKSNVKNNPKEDKK
jgi:hypothetical protein